KHHLRPTWRACRKLPNKVILFGARIAKCISPNLKVERERLYPPTGMSTSTCAWVDQFGRALGARIVEVDAACSVLNKLPKTVHGEIRRQFLMDQSCFNPSSFVATVPYGRVLDDGFVITPDNQLLDDVSIHFRAPVGKRLPTIAASWRL